MISECLFASVLVYSLAMFAIPCAAAPISCGHVTLNRDFGQIITNVRAYQSVDRRLELTAGASVNKLSVKEVNQLRKTVGAFYCPASDGFKRSVGTAFVIGASNEIFTAGHITTNDEGKSRDLKGCLFTNFSNPRESIEIDPSNKRNLLPSWGPQTGNRRYDRARLVLKKPITGAAPLQPDFDQNSLAKGQELFLLSSQNRDMKTSGKDPIISPCSVQSTQDLGDGVGRMRTDCDSDHGSSGGPLIYRKNGRLTVKAMAVTSVDFDAPDNAPYDDQNNYANSLVIDGDFLSWVKRAK